MMKWQELATAASEELHGLLERVPGAGMACLMPCYHGQLHARRAGAHLVMHACCGGTLGQCQRSVLLTPSRHSLRSPSLSTASACEDPGTGADLQHAVSEDLLQAPLKVCGRLVGKGVVVDGRTQHLLAQALGQLRPLRLLRMHWRCVTAV